MKCDVCKQEVTDITSHIFVCPGVQKLVEESQKPKPTVDQTSKKDAALTPSLIGQDTTERNIEKAATFGDRYGSIPVLGQRGDYLAGEELTKAIELIKSLGSYMALHKEGDKSVGFNSSNFIRQMNFRAMKYGDRTLVSRRQYEWLLKIESEIDGPDRG